MIEKVNTVFLYVADQDRSLEFFSEKLGMRTIRDDEMWPGARWLEVAPEGAATGIALAAARDFDREPGGSVPFTLSAANVRELREQLIERGVEVDEPKEEGWATTIRVTDPDGHEILVGEPTSSEPE